MSAPFDAEVAILGGGPSGASTALHLLTREPSLRGRVMLFEKRPLPREKVCGGALSVWGLATLARLGLADRVEGRAIDAFALRTGERVQRLRRPGLGVVVRRSVFDHMLFREARARGAAAFEACGVTDARREDGGWVVRSAQGEHRVRLIVGADGASGLSRRLLGLGEPSRKAHLYVYETPGELEARDGVAEGTLLFDLTPIERGVQGYYWDFPAPLDGVAGTSRGIFHLNTDTRMADGGLKQAFQQSLAERGVVPEASGYKPYAIRPYVPGARCSVPGALLTGEAVGIDPVTGEGIAHALEYGRLAADEVLRALATGDTGFERWTDRVRRSFIGRHLRQACWLAPKLYGRHGPTIARALARTPSVVDLGLRWYVGQQPTARDAATLAALVGQQSLIDRVRALAL